MSSWKTFATILQIILQKNEKRTSTYFKRMKDAFHGLGFFAGYVRIHKARIDVWYTSLQVCTHRFFKCAIHMCTVQRLKHNIEKWLKQPCFYSGYSDTKASFSVGSRQIQYKNSKLLYGPNKQTGSLYACVRVRTSYSYVRDLVSSFHHLNRTQTDNFCVSLLTANYLNHVLQIKFKYWHIRKASAIKLAKQPFFRLVVVDTKM